MENGSSNTFLSLIMALPTISSNGILFRVQHSTINNNRIDRKTSNTFNSLRLMHLLKPKHK